MWWWNNGLIIDFPAINFFFVKLRKRQSRVTQLAIVSIKLVFDAYFEVVTKLTEEIAKRAVGGTYYEGRPIGRIEVVNVRKQLELEHRTRKRKRSDHDCGCDRET